MTRFKLPTSNFPGSSLISAFVGIISFLTVLPNVTAQQCQRTVAQPQQNHACPFYSSEAYTIETKSSQGNPLYQKECCDRKGVTWNQAAVKGCIATSCVPYSNTQPCASLPRYIVNRQYVPYQDVKRDHCQDSKRGQWGQAAVCCPPNSQANLLVSAYGAEANEFPHQARLETEDEICGGTVYNHNTVITAAHCVVDKEGNFKNPRTFRLVLGTNIATSNGVSQGNVYPVERTIVHPGFSLHRSNPEFKRFLIQRRTYNDIALLRLARNIDFSQNIRALPIAPENFHPGQYGSHVTLVGWGTTDNGITSEYLLKANLLVRSDRQCFKGAFGGLPYPNTQEFSAQFHCFGGILNGQNSPVAGKGDSGGPAICRGADGYAVLCGITSFGANVDTCRRNLDETSCLPSVSADVSYFRNWIRSNAGGQDWSTLWRKIIFGNYQSWSNFPHQVQIFSNDVSSHCGGTLISRDTVITAGHCVFTDNRGIRSGIRIKAWGGGWYKITNGGILVPSKFAEYGTLVGMKSTSFQGTTWIDNMAIIKLNGQVPINSASIPSLPRKRPSMAQYVMELAWPMGSRNDGFLVQRHFKILTDNECHRRLQRLSILGVNANLNELTKFFCGVEDYSGGGVCERHLGGGVICPGSGAGVLCGVQTYRFCDMSLPAVFLNVDSYPDITWRSISG